MPAEGTTMKKRFNYKGVCIPEKHYMVDISNKTAQIFKMVEQGEYFVINRPRQYGKTTAIYMLNQFLKTRDEYYPIKMSFEGIGSDSYKSEAKFIEAFLLRMKRVFDIAGGSGLAEFIETSTHVNDINKLDIWLSQLVEKIGRKTILMVDEVDKSCDSQLFLDFLGMLRDKYLKHNQGEDITFHSVILASVHDIKSLKIRIRPDDETKYNSPWNIAADFDVDLAFLPSEIAPMLEEYSTDQQVAIDLPYFAERLFYFTSGYPFLVSYLCRIIDEKILPGKTKKEWLPHDLETAVQMALVENNTNFDSLIKNLENKPDLYNLVFKIIMNEREFSFNKDNPVMNTGTIYGILKKGEGNKTQVNNRLYEQRIYNYMASKMEIAGDSAFNIVSSSYILDDGALDIEKVIRKFQEFMKEQHSKKDNDFIERNGRLLFLAFIKPIINGKGFDFKEVQVSEEKRLDVVITFENKKYIVELKIWRGETYHQEGINQLADYLDRQNQTVGYLLIYDLRKERNKAGVFEMLETNGKEIFAAWI